MKKQAKKRNNRSNDSSICDFFGKRIIAGDIARVLDVTTVIVSLATDSSIKRSSVRDDSWHENIVTIIDVCHQKNVLVMLEFGKFRRLHGTELDIISDK